METYLHIISLAFGIGIAFTTGVILTLDILNYRFIEVNTNNHFHGIPPRDVEMNGTRLGKETGEMK